jgi:hypothetical protein
MAVFMVMLHFLRMGEAVSRGDRLSAERLQSAGLNPYAVATKLFDASTIHFT